ncbi:uncharacterized protein [Henckelia pumila]|uniref:uncharacterized protein n=1 Tax=Henckelia pumila TaxID=405737 RepID=UPI003C6DD9E2
MPSGPKKRKAARKKKGKEYHDNYSDPSSPSAHSREVDDGKHQDDRESDTGELSSPASQDPHSHQNLLTDGEEDEIEKHESCSAVPSVEALKIDVGEEPNIVMIEDENAGEVKREIEIPDESDKKDERIECYEPSKKSKEAGSSHSSGGGSSSCDESNDVENTRNVDVSPVHDSVKAAAVPETSSKTLHGDTTGEAGDSSCPIEKSEDRCPVESVVDENEEEKMSSFEHKVYNSNAFTDAEEETTIRPIEDIATTSDPKAFEKQESGLRMTRSYDPAGAEDSAVSEPLLAPTATSPPEKTSWKSCCGVFEVFAKSDR